MFTREEIMNDPAVHNLTKQVLELSAQHDVLDRYFDVRLALDILKQEMDMAIGDIDDLTHLKDHLRKINPKIVEDKPSAIKRDARERDDLTAYSFKFSDNEDGTIYELRGVLHDRENYPYDYLYAIETEGYQYHFDIRDLWKIAGVTESKNWNSDIKENQLEAVAHEIINHFDAMLELIERAE